VRAALLLVLVAGAAGCVQHYDATSLGVPVTMASAAGSPAQGTRFKTDSHPVYGLWGLLSISSANLERALNRQLVGGAGVADLKIKARSRWSDVLITVLTAGLVVPRTVTFEGVIVPP
jgi:hypothetical protein